MINIDHRISRRFRMNRLDCLRFQLMTELCFIKKLELISTDLDILAHLAVMSGPSDLKVFCQYAAREIYPPKTDDEKARFPGKVQYVRNRLVKLVKRGLVEKSTSGTRQVWIDPKVPVQSKGSILLDYQFLSLDTAQT